MQGCQKVSERLVELTGVVQPLAEPGGGASGEYRWGSPLEEACG